MISVRVCLRLIMKARFDLRFPAGLVQCAFYLIAQFGHPKPGDDRRPLSFARRNACAMFSVACALDETISKGERTRFWREVMGISSSEDTTPLEWRRAVEQLRSRHKEFFELAGVDTYDNTVRMFDLAMDLAKLPEPMGALGHIFMEMAEARRTRYKKRAETVGLFQRWTDRLDEPPYRILKGARIVFNRMTGRKPAWLLTKEFVISEDHRGKVRSPKTQMPRFNPVRTKRTTAPDVPSPPVSQARPNPVSEPAACEVIATQPAPTVGRDGQIALF